MLKSDSGVLRTGTTICQVEFRLLNVFSSHLPRSSIKNSTLFLQTARTSFDPHLYSSGSSSAGPTLVESSNCSCYITPGCLQGESGALN